MTQNAKMRNERMCFIQVKNHMYECEDSTNEKLYVSEKEPSVATGNQFSTLWGQILLQRKERKNI